jgi:hypothetical protein
MTIDVRGVRGLQPCVSCMAVLIDAALAIAQQANLSSRVSRCIRPSVLTGKDRIVGSAQELQPKQQACLTCTQRRVALPMRQAQDFAFECSRHTRLLYVRI